MKEFDDRGKSIDKSSGSTSVRNLREIAQTKTEGTNLRDVCNFLFAVFVTQEQDTLHAQFPSRVARKCIITTEYNFNFSLHLDLFVYESVSHGCIIPMIQFMM